MKIEEMRREEKRKNEKRREEKHEQREGRRGRGREEKREEGPFVHREYLGLLVIDSSAEAGLPRGRQFS